MHALTAPIKCGDVFPDELDTCLKFVLEVMKLKMYRFISLVALRRTVRIFTDASYENDIAKLCGIVCCKASNTYRGWVMTLPEAAFSGFKERETQIIAAEALAVIVTFAFERKLLENTNALCFIDTSPHFQHLS